MVFGGTEMVFGGTEMVLDYYKFNLTSCFCYLDIYYLIFHDLHKKVYYIKKRVNIKVKIGYIVCS